MDYHGNRARQGATGRRDRGYRYPPVSRRARHVAEYRDEEDNVGRFLGDCCTPDLLGTINKPEMYSAYVAWCSENAENPVSKKTLGIRLKTRSILEGHTGSKHFWAGLKLTARDDGPDGPDGPVVSENFLHEATQG